MTATARCAPRSTGAMPCSRNPIERCSAGCPSSPVLSERPPRRPSSPTGLRFRIGAASAAILADLADQSLLIATADPSGTRYRALETIRQYGAERLRDTGELVEAHSRHVRWCVDQSAALSVTSHQDVPGWRVAFDLVADELRGALAWAAGSPEQRPAAYRLALGLAELTFRRGMPAESQHRYEQAAELAPGEFAAAAAWRNAAGAAESRHVGTDALRLRGAAADAAVRAGDRAGAAANLARNAELINRGPGLMSTEPPADDVAALLGEGWLKLIEI